MLVGRVSSISMSPKQVSLFLTTFFFVYFWNFRVDTEALFVNSYRLQHYSSILRFRSSSCLTPSLYITGKVPVPLCSLCFYIVPYPKNKKYYFLEGHTILLNWNKCRCLKTWNVCLRLCIITLSSVSDFYMYSGNRLIVAWRNLFKRRTYKLGILIIVVRNTPANSCYLRPATVWYELAETKQNTRNDLTLNVWFIAE